MPRVIALGGASAAPNPGQGCSGYLIEQGTMHIVLDLGPGTLTELRRHCDLDLLSGIILSHLHIDHMLDLIALWWGWLYHPQPLPEPIPLWLPPGGMERLRRTLSTLGRTDEVDRFYGDIFEVAEYAPGETLRIVDATVSFAPTAHFIPCWAMRVELAGTVVAYTADTGPNADLVDIARGADVLIAEAMLRVGSFEESPGRGSSSPTEAADLARRAGAKRLMLTHFWSEDDASEAVRRATQVFDGPLTIARPGLTVAW